LTQIPSFAPMKRRLKAVASAPPKNMIGICGITIKVMTGKALRSDTSSHIVATITTQIRFRAAHGRPENLKGMNINFALSNKTPKPRKLKSIIKMNGNKV